MNYQQQWSRNDLYAQLQMGASPPPPLPALDPNEVDINGLSLYQRRATDTMQQMQQIDNGVIQPLNVGGHGQYNPYDINGIISPPRSAPVHGIAIKSNQVSHSKTPRQFVTLVNKSNIKKPLATPATPSPPPPVNKKLSQSTSAKDQPILKLTGHSTSNASAIIALTPQSANLNSANSASNHSTASQNTTSTILSVSEGQHSVNAAMGIKKNIINKNNNLNINSKQQIASNVVKAATLNSNNLNILNLNNPIPPVNNRQGSADIVIPMDQVSYNNVLLQQMNIYQQQQSNNTKHTRTQDDLNDLLKDPYNNTLGGQLNMYPGYDQHGYNQQNMNMHNMHNGYYGNMNNGFYNNPHPHPTQYHHNNPSNISKSASDLYNNSYHHNNNNNNMQYGGFRNNMNMNMNMNGDQYMNQYNNQNHRSFNQHHNNHSQQRVVQQVEVFHKAQSNSPKPNGGSNFNRQRMNSLNNNGSNLNEDAIIHTIPDYLHRVDGTIISPNADPKQFANLTPGNSNGDDEADAFTAGDDALFGDIMCTLIAVNWNKNIPFATIRLHSSNRIHFVPLMDLTNIANKKNIRVQQQLPTFNKNNNRTVNIQKHGIKNHQNNQNTQRYRMGGNMNMNMNMKLNGHSMEGLNGAINNELDHKIPQELIIRRNPKLSDETLMKLPHLRKHRDYIRTIDVNMGPKDYNSYRVSVNSKNNGDEEDGDEHRTTNIQQQAINNNNHNNNNNNNLNTPMINKNSLRTASLLAHNTGNLNATNKRGKSGRNRMAVSEKGDLFKTELCENWVKKGHCTYGKKCHFAHGREDIRTRWRIENYKTQPCCDPARADSRLCLFGKRCNYAHPGEQLRRSHHSLYLDEEYEAEIKKDYGQNTPFPFGIYI